MEKTTLLAIILLPPLLILSFVMIYGNPTGMAVSDMQGPPGEIPVFGPSEAEMSCMTACTTEKCSADDMVCRKADGPRCQAQCNVYKPEQTEEESCVDTCTSQGCDEFDFECKRKNQAKCDKECGMVGEPEAGSEEEQCIRDCVTRYDPALMCSGSAEGEAGNEVCQKCAAECVHLYAGPCLNDEQIREKEQECQTCEHCYGEPVMGDSGQGYECIVDVSCEDASAEWGDMPGSGEGIAREEGIVSRTTESIGNMAERAVSFFKGLFGFGKEDEMPEQSKEIIEEFEEIGPPPGMAYPPPGIEEIRGPLPGMEGPPGADESMMPS